jgi:uncharacterized secreted protein with C-terminal beta-propeller domain
MSLTRLARFIRRVPEALSSARSPARAPKRLRFEPLEDRRVFDAAAPAAIQLPTSDFSAVRATIPVEMPAVTLLPTVGFPFLPVIGDPSQQANPTFHSLDEFKQYLIDGAVRQYEYLFGKHQSEVWWFCDTDDNQILLDSYARTADIASASTSHSDTNTQVQGVDEGDMVENDGEFLYVISSNTLSVIDVRDPAELKVVSRMSLQGRAQAEYLTGQRLTILSTSENGGTTVTVLDVADRYSPRLVQRTEMDGTCLDSRVINNRLYLVLSNFIQAPSPLLLVDGDPSRPAPAQGPNGPLVYPCVLRYSGDAPTASRPDYVYETKEQYVARVESQFLDLVLPDYTSFNSAGGQSASGYLAPPEEIYQRSNALSNLYTVAVFNLAGDAPGPQSTLTVPLDSASCGTPLLYASQANLYLLSTSWTYDDQSLPGIYSERTNIIKLSPSDAEGDLFVAAEGGVPGRVLDQFSVDEYQGLLRIATTTGFSGSTRNQLYVLRQDGDDLTMVGSLENLTPGEALRSARFSGDRAFLVTFLQIDPLLAVDLSDPAHLHLDGQLEIPGFSNYLHDVGNDWLLGIGCDVNPDTGRRTGYEVSLFDTADPSHPELADRFTIDSETPWISAITTHHAVAYYPESGILTVGVADSGGYWAASASDDLWVFHVDAPQSNGTNAREGHLSMLGRISHDASVQRSVRIGTHLFAISDNEVTSHDLLDPQATLDGVQFLDALVARRPQPTTTAAETGQPTTAPTASKVLSSERPQTSTRHSSKALRTGERRSDPAAVKPNSQPSETANLSANALARRHDAALQGWQDSEGRTKRHRLP